MSFNKWVPIKSRREKAAQVAARMLRGRLAAIARFLPLAAESPSNDTESVHQLRVWSRRADAAVDFSAKLLRRRDRRRLKKHLKLVRKAASVARDADVLRMRIAALPGGLAREQLLDLVDRRRREAQTPVVAALEKLKGGKKLLDLQQKVCRRLKRKRNAGRFARPVGVWSHRRLRPIAKAFFRYGEQDLSDVEALHCFRIAGKRLRYAMELVAAAYPRRFRKQLYGGLLGLQSRLGTINDLSNLVRLIEDLLAQTKKRTLKTQLRRLLAAQQKRLAAAREEWNGFWTAERARRMKRKFDRYL